MRDAIVPVSAACSGGIGGIGSPISVMSVPNRTSSGTTYR
jgi:hypothetical protein